MLRLCNTALSSAAGCALPLMKGSGGQQILVYRQHPKQWPNKQKQYKTFIPTLCNSRNLMSTEELKRGSSVLLPVVGVGLGVGSVSLEGVQSVIEAVGVLAAIVTVHECGHFLAAYLQNIHVSKFAIGFGPTLLKFNVKSVECSLRAIPLGGYVGFPDNEPESAIPADDKDLLKNRPILDRFTVTVAGVVANIVFAYTILFAQVLTVGMVEQEPFPGVLVPQVFSGSPAARDGMEAGDVVLAVNGRLFSLGEPAAAVFDMVDIIKKNPGKPLSFLVERRKVESKLLVDVTPDGAGKIGVQLAPNAKIVKVKAQGVLDGAVRAGLEFGRVWGNVVGGLKQVLLNFSETARQVSGPVGIVAVGAEAARSTVEGVNLFQYAALVNVNLAVVNLLPLPALDGGYLALIALEAARGGKKLPKELEQAIMSSGITLLLFLGFFLIIRDTLNLDFVREML